MAEQIFKVFIWFGETPQFLSLEKEPSFLNGGLLFLESIFFLLLVFLIILNHLSHSVGSELPLRAQITT